MLKKHLFYALILLLAGCSSLEKIHRFKVDRSDNESLDFICNTSDKDYYEIIIVEKNHFFIEKATAPEWVGPLFIPFIPGSFTERISEMRMTFKRKTPDNIQDWKLRFASDDLVVSPKVSANQAIFTFPARSPSDKFELAIPGQGKTTQIKFIPESTQWKYRPFYIIFGDRFPFNRCNH